MSTQRALVHQSKGIAEVRSDKPLPSLREEFIIVKTEAVALNPTDWKSLHDWPKPGAIVGCDYAGVVEQIGNKVTTQVKVGDRVAGFVRGGDANGEDGAFAEHILAKDGIFIKLADSLSSEEGATLGVGITTVGQGLYQSLGLPLPPAKVQEHTPILIYGASTATGTLAVQYAKLSGAHVIATASPHNFDLIKSLGADEVFDYRDPDVSAKIRKSTNDGLRLVFDCISEKGSVEICAAAIGSKGGHYSSLCPVKEFPRDDVKNTLTLAYSALGEKFRELWPASEEDYQFGKKFWKVSEDLLNSGAVKVHPTEVRPDGLEGIPQGLKDLKENRVSGKKLVYKI